MWCPKCAGKTKVNGTDASETVTRTRKCLACGYVFMTTEAVTFDSFWAENAKRAYEADKRLALFTQEKGGEDK